MTDGRITLGERTYELGSWSVADGDVWAFRLLKIVTAAATSTAPALASDGPSEDHAAALEAVEDGLSVSAILERVSPEDFLAFRDACFKHTSIVAQDKDGEELVQPLTREAMRGRYSETLAIIKVHIVREFAPFLLSAGMILGGGAPKAKAAKGAGSSSPRASTG